MVGSWLQRQDVTSLSSSLVRILHQTLECLADSRWELRRMAQQVWSRSENTVCIMHSSRLHFDSWANLPPNSFLVGNYKLIGVILHNYQILCNLRH